MNMNKKIVYLMIIFTLFFGLKNNINAASFKTVWNSTNEIVINNNLMAEKLLAVNNNTNNDERVLEKPCTDTNILQVLHFIGFLLFLAKILIPLLIIGFATFDLFKAVTDKDDQSLKKQTRIVLTRILSGLIVFFLPSIVYALFGISTQFSTYRESKYQTCVDCLLKPTSGNCR